MLDSVNGSVGDREAVSDGEMEKVAVFEKEKLVETLNVGGGEMLTVVVTVGEMV